MRRGSPSTSRATFSSAKGRKTLAGPANRRAFGRRYLGHVLFLLRSRRARRQVAENQARNSAAAACRQGRGEGLRRHRTVVSAARRSFAQAGGKALLQRLEQHFEHDGLKIT